jgi:hypothetical protein
MLAALACRLPGVLVAALLSPACLSPGPLVTTLPVATCR